MSVNLLCVLTGRELTNSSLEIQSRQPGNTNYDRAGLRRRVSENFPVISKMSYEDLVV
jgi:hypothetical protein